MSYKVWLGLAVSLILLWVAFRGVELHELGRSLGQIRSVWLLPAVASVFVHFWLTAVRWQVLLRPVRLIGVHRLFGVTMIGFMANNVLPARMGEFVRAYALRRTEGLPASLAFATVVLERVFDGLTMVLFLVGGLTFLRPEPWLLWSAAGSLALYLGVLGVLFSLRSARHRARLTGILARLPTRVGAPVTSLLESFRLGLDVLGDWRALGATAALSLALWGVSVLGVQATFAAFSLDLPAHAAFLLLAIIAVALVVPSTPGYVGPLQAATVLALALFGVPKATALSLSLVYHAVNYVPITLIGLLYLGSLRLTLGELRTAGEKAR